MHGEIVQKREREGLLRLLGIPYVGRNAYVVVRGRFERRCCAPEGGHSLLNPSSEERALLTRQLAKREAHDVGGQAVRDSGRHLDSFIVSDNLESDINAAAKDFAHTHAAAAFADICGDARCDRAGAGLAQNDAGSEWVACSLTRCRDRRCQVSQVSAKRG